MSKQNMLQTIREHKTLFVVLGVLLLLIEIEIFAVAAMKSGRKATIQVLNAGGSVIYEADGDNLSQFDRYYFEQNFGPLDRYELRFVTRQVPFPFRAWFAAAFGIPVGVMLLFAFLVRAYLAIFYGESAAPPPSASAHQPEPGQSRFERLLLMVSRFNIFVIGFMILVAIAAYWVVPNLITDIGRIGIGTVVRHKWTVLGIAAVALALIVWMVYLRFLLAKKAIESRAELERYRLELEFQSGTGEPKRIEDRENRRSMVAWAPQEDATSGSDPRDGSAG